MGRVSDSTATGMTKLVFIGGAPGVGKSTVARELLRRTANSVWLDGDDLWRMQPFVVNAETTDMVERNIQFALRSFLKTGFRFIFFTWVMHDQAIVDRLLKSLDRESFDFAMFALVCDDAELRARLSQDPSRTTNVELALRRLRETQQLGAVKIDTTKKDPREVAYEILAHLQE